MGKRALAFKTEDVLKQLANKNSKLLFTTHHFKLLGIVTWDRMVPDESLGVRRRWIKGLVIENGRPLEPEDRVFETSLHRKNPKTGRLEDIISHEDDLVIITERKTFDMSDDEENFQFMPNMHIFNDVKRISDEVVEGRRRIGRLEEEKNQALLDTEFYQRQAVNSAEREKTVKETLNRLTRENVQLQEKIGNLESIVMNLKARNMQYESTVDEQLANAQERGTVLGMTPEDAILHAAQKQKEIASAMLDIAPGAGAVGEEVYGEIDALKEQVQQLNEQVAKFVGVKPVSQQKPERASAAPQQPAG